METLAHVAVGLCVQQERTGKIIAVSRGVGSDNWNLPGGKLERTDSDLLSGAVRETQEETGYVFYEGEVLVNMHPFVDVCLAQDPGDINYISIFYHIVDGGELESYIRPSVEGDVAVVDPHVILNGRFGQYNKRLMKYFQVLERFDNGR
jgi:8-oxo-dGTP pyrophosphatase MutT (NUDIX family)